MGDVLFARQPIFDRDQRILAFALTLGPTRSASSVETSSVLVRAFSSIDLDAVLAGQPVHLTVNDAFIRSGTLAALPRDRMVYEIDANARIDETFLKQASQLATQGYSLLCTDAHPRAQLGALLPFVQGVMVHIGERSIAEVASRLNRLPAGKHKIYATEVDTHEAFDLCSEMGFEAFRGPFLCRPRPVLGKTARADRATLLQVINAVHAREVDLRAVQNILRHDVGMSFRLLRIINSAYHGLARQVTSIDHAVRLMGTRKLKQWVTVMSLANLDDKPPAIFHTALTRAFMAEQLALQAGENDVETFFLAGLFSTLDALLDRNLDEVVDSLPLSDELRRGLLHREGRLGEALNCVIAQEQCALLDAQFAPLDPWAVQDAYMDALHTASAIASQATPLAIPA